MIQLTSDHRYRMRALAVPGAFWDRAAGAYCVVDPEPRAAAAAIALFPHVLNEHPELTEIRERAYGGDSIRPTDYATPYGHRLEVDLEDLTLRDWQATDLGYIRAILQRDGGGNLLWDRGLGKTVATAAFIKALGCDRTLVVCRNDAKDAVWRAQLEEVLPKHTLMVLPNPKAKRERMLDYLNESTGGWAGSEEPFIFIVHYEALAIVAGDRGRGNGWDKLPEWDLMAFDEGHRLATMNPNAHGKNTQMGYATMKARKRSRMALNLTGTTIMNHAEDMFGQLHYLYPESLYDDEGRERMRGYKAKWRDYNNRFLDYVDVGGGRKECIGFKAETLPDLRRELGVFSVYRTKAEELDLPPVIHQEILLDLEPAQARVYGEMADNFWAMTEDGGALKAGNVLAQLNHLRQIATWVEGVPSAKLNFAANEVVEDDEQWVFFTWYKSPGRAFAELVGDDAVVVDGDVSKNDRVLNLHRHKNGSARVLIGSIETIGESLNLQYCSRAVRVDRHWNPGKNKQTFDRLVRDGQENSVLFLDLIARNTVDELRVQPALTSKESLRKAVFGS